MRNTNKKGFTIVELVIVVAVIAILAAVLIPTFSSIIRKANLSSDQQAVRHLNTALATSVDKPESLRELADILKEAGYNTKDGFNSLLSDYAIFWYNTDKYNVIVLATIADGTIYAPAEDEEMVAAFKADFNDPTKVYNLKDLAAEVFVGDKHYATLVEAVKEELLTKDEVVIDLYNDTYFAEPVAVPTGKTLTFNLNGHTISSVMTEAAGGALIQNNGTLIINDSTGNGRITTEATHPDLQDSPGYANNVITNTGNLVINGGVIENTTTANAACAYAVDNAGGSTFTMTGGTLTSAFDAVRFQAYTGDITANISGGTINATGSCIWLHASSRVSNVEINITGGTFNDSGDNAAEPWYAIHFGSTTGEGKVDENTYGSTTINVSGITVNGGVYVQNLLKDHVTIDEETVTGQIIWDTDDNRKN